MGKSALLNAAGRLPVLMLWARKCCKHRSRDAVVAVPSAARMDKPLNP